MQITLTPLADAGITLLPPDIVWLTPNGSPANGGYGVRGDFALAAGGAQGAGALAASNPLQTAVILCLMSDARPPKALLDRFGIIDARGWPGDSFDLETANGEQPLGSYLWAYRRADLNDLTAMEVAAEAKRALQPLKTQGAVASIEASASPDFVRDAMSLSVALYARNGSQIYAAQFDLLWSLATGGT